jgi:hypothetical protein
MKKITLTILLFITLLLSACSGVAPATQSAAPVDNVPTKQPVAPPPAATQGPARNQSITLNTDYENAVPITMQLLLGTFKLEGTANAVTKEQASALTSLWANFKTLSESMRPAQGEPGQQGKPNGTPQPVDSGLQTQLDEIIKQIKAALTAEQIQAIAEMKITQDVSRTIMEEQGITMGGPQQGGGNMQEGGQPPAGGEMPQGIPSAGGSGGEQQPNAGQMGMFPIDGTQRDMGFIPQELVDALIQLLQKKVAP